MATISGILTDGTGQIINDCTIELYAKKTTTNVLTQTQAFTVTSAGRYSMSVSPCEYDVGLIINGFPKKRLGTINVYSNSANGTLNDFLINPKESELTPEFIKQVIDARDDAKKSALQATTSATEAKTSETNAKSFADTAKTSANNASVSASSASKSAATATEASTKANTAATNSKACADNASKLATDASQSAKQASDSETAAKTSETNANNAAKNAKTSEDNAKKWASTIDTSTLVKKTGDTMTGQLILPKNGLKINYDNKNIMALITADDNYSHVFYDAEKKQWLSKLVYNSTTNSWSFQYINDVAINGKSVLKTGDAIQTFGDLSTTINLNELTGLNEGVYYQGRNTSAVIERGYPINQAGTLQVFKNGADGAGCCQIYTTYRNARQFIRNYRGGTKTWEEWNEVITTGNSGDFIQTGDYGIGALTGTKLDNPDETLKGGCYATRTTEFTELTEYQNRNDSASLVVYPAWTEKWYVEKLAVVQSKTPRIYYRCATPDGKQTFYESITTANINKYIIPIGEFRLMPFRAGELPFGWYFRNGDNYLLSSPQGQALNRLSNNYKHDHQITIKNINGQQYINVPSAFASDGRGYFERAIDGTTRQVGDVEGDSMRQLSGCFLGFNETGNNIDNMFYANERYIFDASGSQQNRGLNLAWNVFNNNRVNNPVSNENRPLNIGLTPAIYLGV